MSSSQCRKGMENESEFLKCGEEKKLNANLGDGGEGEGGGGFHQPCWKKNKLNSKN